MAVFGLNENPARMVAVICTVLLGIPLQAHAMTGPLVDTVADVIAVIVLIFVPIGAVYLFWMVHILPEKIAEKRQHPQKEAIRTLCLLSLIFGGMLWPIAWLWAYSKPVMYRLAYGTDKHEDYYKESQEVTPAAQEELARIRARIEQLSKKAGDDSNDLEALRKALREELEHLETQLAKSQKQPVKQPNEKGPG